MLIATRLALLLPASKSLGCVTSEVTLSGLLELGWTASSTMFAFLGVDVVTVLTGLSVLIVVFGLKGFLLRIILKALCLVLR